MVEEIVARFGYPALLVGTFVEGETILVVAGFAAHQGYLQLGWVILAAFVGSLAGDQFAFFLGRHKGGQTLERHPSWQHKAVKVDLLITRHGFWIMLGFRFMYGMRTITPFVIGTTQISSLRFFALNAAGALVWSVAISLLGYLCGATAETLLRNVRRIEHWIALAIIGVGAAVWLFYFFRRRKAGIR
jgi:membrane protein DedA with SNARE-associated domain